MKKVAVVLLGCGVFDGSEIHESVCSLLALAKAGVQYECLAPDINQSHVSNHLTQDFMKESRNVLVESARIARGEIKNISKVDPADYDAVIYPGGFGAAVNGSNFAEKGDACVIEPSVLAFAKAIAASGKPQGFICIAPAMVSKIYGEGVRHTIGTDADTAEKIRAMGGEHVDCHVSDVVVDEAHKVVTTPAYMLANNIAEVEVGVTKLINAVLELI